MGKGVSLFLSFHHSSSLSQLSSFIPLYLPPSFAVICLHSSSLLHYHLDLLFFRVSSPAIKVFHLCHFQKGKSEKGNTKKEKEPQNSTQEKKPEISFLFTLNKAEVAERREVIILSCLVWKWKEKMGKGTK
jgi:hypothetical protein